MDSQIRHLASQTDLEIWSCSLVKDCQINAIKEGKAMPLEMAQSPQSHSQQGILGATLGMDSISVLPEL